jgi:hypothetical protein
VTLAVTACVLIVAFEAEITRLINPPTATYAAVAV